jgi:hypothetical protein
MYFPLENEQVHNLNISKLLFQHRSIYFVIGKNSLAESSYQVFQPS